MYKQQTEITIIKGNHDGLKTFIFDTLRKYTNISKKNIELILSDKNMIEFKKAFTTPLADPMYNYEFYEMLGDSTSNNCVVWYFQRRFFPEPETLITSKGTMNPVAVMGRLKQEGASVRQYSKFANHLGFLPYITMTNIDNTRVAKILEDVFEAFIGCLVYHSEKIFGLHIGLTIVYPILQKLFDREDISIEKEKLYEPKSLVNEDITKLPKNYAKLKYEHIYNENTDNPALRFYTKAIIYENSNNNILIETTGVYGSNKQDNEQKVARILLKMDSYQSLKNKFGIP